MKKHYVLSMIRLCLFLLLLIVILAGCGVKESADSAIISLNDAISKLEIQSANWQTVLEETRSELIREGKSTIANEISMVLSRSISDVGIEARCYTDFLRDRVKEDLIRIRASLTGETLNLRPVFCNPNPNSVNFAEVQDGSTETIEVSGYNLDFENLQGKLRILLEDNDGNGVDITDQLDYPSRYLITLPFGQNGVTLSPNSRRFVFEIAGTTHTVSVINPVKPPSEPQEFKLGPVGGGGGEYFEDSVPMGAKVRMVRVRAGKRIDAVQMILDTGSLAFHGGGGGALHEWQLQEGEYITAIVIKFGDRIDSLQIETNLRASPRWGGGGGHTENRFDAPIGMEIVGFYGRSGAELDALGMIVRSR